jgi:hypothetical protein
MLLSICAALTAIDSFRAHMHWARPTRTAISGIAMDVMEDLATTTEATIPAELCGITSIAVTTLVWIPSKSSPEHDAPRRTKQGYSRWHRRTTLGIEA